MKEQEVIDTARVAFRETTGGVLNVQKVPGEVIWPYDYLIGLKLRQYNENLLVELKNEVRRQDVPQILALFRKAIPDYTSDKILIAQYIPGPVKNELKKLHINYLEASGNCYIELENLFLYVNDRKAAPARKTNESKLWNKTGLKYVFAVLTDSEITALPLREQAARAGIALGNLTALREELKQYLTPGATAIHESAREHLLERWGLQYNHLLKPTLEIGTFRFLKPEMKENWKNLPIPKKTWWGGENAGAMITHYLRPQEFTIYTRNKTQVVVDMRLVPDENGDIHIYEPFWPVGKDQPNQNHVHPFIAWAELNFELDQRLRETADRIKKKTEYFGNNG